MSEELLHLIVFDSKHAHAPVLNCCAKLGSNGEEFARLVRTVVKGLQPVLLVKFAEHLKIKYSNSSSCSHQFPKVFPPSYKHSIFRNFFKLYSLLMTFGSDIMGTMTSRLVLLCLSIIRLRRGFYFLYCFHFALAQARVTF
jgi:hypothetical protein